MVMRIAAVFTIALLSLFTCDAVSAQDQPSQEEEPLCNNGEDVYFSCPLANSKTVSVCAKGNTAPDQGYVQYRYGTKDNAFAFPNMSTPPVSTVKITDVSEGSIGGLHLKFSNGPYTYVVSSVSPGGIYVLKKGKIVFDKECQASRYKSFSDKVFDGINDAPVSKVDIH